MKESVYREIIVGVSYHYTALHMATRLQDETMIRLLVKLGADINLGEKKPFLESPLHLAANKRSLAMTKLLLDLGADMNVKNGNDEPPFVQAALKGNKALVELYKKYGFDINMRDKSGKSLLHRAVQWPSTVKFLLQQGLDANAKTGSGTTPLHSYMTTVGTDTAAVPKLLVQYGADVNAATKNGNTPLCEALAHDKLATAIFLIESGADVNTGKSGWAQTGPAIHLTNGNLEIAMMLVDVGADVNSKDPKGRNVIHNMIDSSGGTNEVETLEYFLEHGVDINGQDNEGKTPLFYCVEKERIDLLDALIERGADVHATDNKGRTPLWHAAARTKSKIMVKQLVNHGAKTEIQDKDGTTLKKMLEIWKQEDMLTFIQSL